MIKHVVCFKIKEECKNEIPSAKETLLSMKDHIDYLVSINVGVDFLHSERSYDIILEVVLPTKEHLDIYQNDEYHCNVVKTLMHRIREASVAIDYEVE